MTRIHTIAFRLLIASASFLFVFCREDAGPNSVGDSTNARDQTDASRKKRIRLLLNRQRLCRPGMTGSDASDPRAKLAPGMYDAAETSMGIKHLLLLKKPDAFQLGTDDPNDPKVEKTLGLLGIRRRLKDAEADAVSDRSTGVCKLGPCVPG